MHLSKELMAIAGHSLKANITTLGPLVLPVSEQLTFLAYLFARRVRAHHPAMYQALCLLHARGWVVITQPMVCPVLKRVGPVTGACEDCALQHPRTQPFKASDGAPLRAARRRRSACAARPTCRTLRWRLSTSASTRAGAACWTSCRSSSSCRRRPWRPAVLRSGGARDVPVFLGVWGHDTAIVLSPIPAVHTPQFLSCTLLPWPSALQRSALAARSGRCAWCAARW